MAQLLLIIFSGPLGLGSSDIWRQSAARADVLGSGGGVLTCAGVAFCGVSHFQSDFVGSLCFSMLEGSPFQII